MTRKLTFKLRRDREAEGQEPLFEFTALSDFADRWYQQYKESAHYKKGKKSFPRTLYLYIVFCVENDLRNEAARGIQELIYYFERIYGFLPPAEAGVWQLRLARKKQEGLGSSVLDEPEGDFLRGLAILQNNEAEHTRDYLIGMRDLAQYYSDQNENELSSQVIRDAYETAVKSGTTDNDLLVRFQGNVGLIHYRAKEYEEAAFHFGWALRRMRVYGLKSAALEYSIRKDYASSLALSGGLMRASVQFAQVAQVAYDAWGNEKVAEESAHFYENRSAYCLAIHAYNLSRKDNNQTALQLYEKALVMYEMMTEPYEKFVRECGDDYIGLLKRLEMNDEARDVEARVLDIITGDLGLDEE